MNSSDASSQEELDHEFLQSSGEEMKTEKLVTTTRRGTYCRNLRRVKKGKPSRLVRTRKTKQIRVRKPVQRIEQSALVDIKTEPLNKEDISKEADDLKSDIDEDECIPNGSKLIECFICSCRLSKIYNLRSHLAAHTGEDSFDMDAFEQSEIFNILNPHKRNIDSKIIRNFVIEEIKAKRYSQFYCILNEAAVELHISDSETDSDDAGELIPHTNYRCELCKKNFDRRYQALFHQKTSHVKSDLTLGCDYCTKKFVCMNLLIHHLKTQCENDERPVPCTERFMKFLLKANLDYYASQAQQREQKKLQKLTEIPKKHTCDVCKKTFTRLEHLNRHSAVHLPDEMKFECSICYRRFNRKDNMRSHMKTHTEEGQRSAESRKILCSYCGRSFSSKSNYVVHMRRHTGEKPYKCDVCGKGFPKSTDLNSHKITHTGERNFICTICDKAFARSAVLSKHMRMHNAPYSCTFCSKTFPKPNALTVHLKTHANGRPFACTGCKKLFNTKEELDAHFEETGHSNETKRVIVIREPLAIIKEDNDDVHENQPQKEQSIEATKTKNDDPLEIKEEEWRTTKVKVPVNEIIQNVLQKSCATLAEDFKKSESTVPKEKIQKIEAEMSPDSPLDNGFEDDNQYSDW